MRFVILTLSSYLLAASFTARASEADLTFILPDQGTVRVLSKPPLGERKMSIVQLQLSAPHPWRPLAFDATMPAHRHGMVVTPTPPKEGSDRNHYEIRGVKLHMPGAWIVKLKMRNEQTGEERWIEHPLLLRP